MKLRKVGDVYHAFFTGINGKVTQVTTKCTTLEAAEKAVKEANLEELEAAAKVSALSHSVISHITAGRKVTLVHAIAEYEKAMTARARSPKTIHNNVINIKAWVAGMRLGNAPLSALTEQDVSRWINRKRSDNSALTRRNCLASLRTFFEFLCDKGWMTHNPASRHLVGVDYSILSQEQKEGSGRNPFTTQEIKRLLGYIKAEWDDAANELAKIVTPDKQHRIANPNAVRLQDRVEAMRFWDFAVRLSHETGLRFGDICGLEWRCFKKDGVLTVWTGKTKKRTEIEVSDAILNLVTCIPVSHPEYVFPREHEINRNPSKRSLHSVQFKRLCIAAGIEDKSFHCLRHTMATENYSKADKNELARKLAESLTVGQIQQLLGHSSIKTTKGYIHD